MQAGPIGVIEVDGVLGQHGDQGQYANDQPLRDVLLGRFGTPRKQEARAEDGYEENGRFENRGRMGAGETEVESRERGEHDKGYIEGKLAYEKELLGERLGGRFVHWYGFLVVKTETAMPKRLLPLLTQNETRPMG